MLGMSQKSEVTRTVYTDQWQSALLHCLSLPTLQHCHLPAHHRPTHSVLHHWCYTTPIPKHIHKPTKHSFIHYYNKIWHMYNDKIQSHIQNKKQIKHIKCPTRWQMNTKKDLMHAIDWSGEVILYMLQIAEKRLITKCKPDTITLSLVYHFYHSITTTVFKSNMTVVTYYYFIIS